MTDETSEPEVISDDELERQQGEPLPDRAAMSIITPGFERPVPLEDAPGSIEPPTMA
jgi:hypothetical protein